jgi:hypothetical protein
LRYFEEPYSNNICPHTFEKSAIIDYVRNQGVAFTQRGHTAPSGPKRAKCPQSGCEQVILSDSPVDLISNIARIDAFTRGLL